MALRIANVVDKARDEIARLVGQAIASVVSCVHDDGHWRVTLETVERKAIPDTADLLAAYLVLLDEAGGLVSFQRLGVRRRGEPVEEREEIGARTS